MKRNQKHYFLHANLIEKFKNKMENDLSRNEMDWPIYLIIALFIQNRNVR